MFCWNCVCACNRAREIRWVWRHWSAHRLKLTGLWEVVLSTAALRQNTLALSTVVTKASREEKSELAWSSPSLHSVQLTPQIHCLDSKKWMVCCGLFQTIYLYIQVYLYVAFEFKEKTNKIVVSYQYALYIQKLIWHYWLFIKVLHSNTVCHWCFFFLSFFWSKSYSI